MTHTQEEADAELREILKKLQVETLKNYESAKKDGSDLAADLLRDAWSLRLDEAMDAVQAHNARTQESNPDIDLAIGLMRQWLNEDRITDPKKLVTNEDLHVWLDRALEAHDARIKTAGQIAILSKLHDSCRTPMDVEDVRVLIMEYIKGLDAQLSPIQPKQDKP